MSVLGVGVDLMETAVREMLAAMANYRGKNLETRKP